MCVISFHRRQLIRVQIFKILKEQKEENWRDDLPTLPTNLFLLKGQSDGALPHVFGLDPRPTPWDLEKKDILDQFPVTMAIRSALQSHQWLAHEGSRLFPDVFSGFLPLVWSLLPLSLLGSHSSLFLSALLPSVCAALSLLVFNLHHNSSKFRVSVDFLCWTIHDTGGFTAWSLFVFVLVSPVVCSSSSFSSTIS